MTSRTPLLLLTLLLAACAASNSDSPSQTAGRCLYTIELEFGRDTRWGSCTTAPPCAIERLTGNNQGPVGPGCK
jgi:hypothetical protein